MFVRGPCATWCADSEWAVLGWLPWLPRAIARAAAVVPVAAASEDPLFLMSQCLLVSPIALAPFVLPVLADTRARGAARSMAVRQFYARAAAGLGTVYAWTWLAVRHGALAGQLAWRGVAWRLCCAEPVSWLIACVSNSTVFDVRLPWLAVRSCAP